VFLAARFWKIASRNAKSGRWRKWDKQETGERQRWWEIWEDHSEIPADGREQEMPAERWTLAKARREDKTLQKSEQRNIHTGKDRL